MYRNRDMFTIFPTKNGIADDYFSTRWFLSEYKNRTGTVCSGVKEIADRVDNDELAKALFDDFGSNLAGFLVPVLANFDANCLVIGGNISRAYPLFCTAFHRVLNEQNINIEIMVSELMESAAMVGSARLLDKEFWTKMEPLVAKI